MEFLEGLDLAAKQYADARAKALLVNGGVPPPGFDEVARKQEEMISGLRSSYIEAQARVDDMNAKFAALEQKFADAEKQRQEAAAKAEAEQEAVHKSPPLAADEIQLAINWLLGRVPQDTDEPAADGDSLWKDDYEKTAWEKKAGAPEGSKKSAKKKAAFNPDESIVDEDVSDQEPDAPTPPKKPKPAPKKPGAARKDKKKDLWETGFSEIEE